jgi:DNA primase small subunit
MRQGKNSAERWKIFQTHLGKYSNKKVKLSPNLVDEIMFQYTYPRLDMEVTKGLNHLLKSPFCIHPKTGRVCVPIDLAKLDSFDPEKVPTITELCHQLEISDFIKSENKVKGDKFL